MSDAASLAVLDALADGALHSGEALAGQFGISRAALAKRIDKLRALGLEVQAQAGSGYQLATAYERLDAERILRHVQWPDERLSSLRLAVTATTDSTNSQLLAANAEADPQVLFSEYQSAGRGRRGRVWLAPMGSCLMFSLAWSFPAWPARLTTLPLAVAVALARAVAAVGLPAVQIKWPNDLQLAGKKLAGILIEPRGEAGGQCRVVIGVGINWNLSAAQGASLLNAFTSLLPELATAMQRPPGRNAFAAKVLSELLGALQHFEAHGFTPFAGEWNARDALRGKPVRIEAAEPFEGVAEGINGDGGLRVTTSTGQQLVHAGEVSVRVRT